MPQAQNEIWWSIVSYEVYVQWPFHTNEYLNAYKYQIVADLWMTKRACMRHSALKTLSIIDTQHNNANMLSVIMLNVTFYLLSCWVSLCWMSLCWVPWPHIYLSGRCHRYLSSTYLTNKYLFDRCLLSRYLTYRYLSRRYFFIKFHLN
jgi:hypothetical protein